MTTHWLLALLLGADTPPCDAVCQAQVQALDLSPLEALPRMDADPPALIVSLAAAPRARERAWAATALGQVRTDAAWRALLAAREDGDPTVRSAVYRGLAAHGDAAATETLVRAATQDPDPAAREAAAKAALTLAGARAPADLSDDLRRLADPELPPDTRAAAARRLGATGDRRAFTPLLGATQAPDDGLRHAAVKSLGALGDRRAVDPLRERLATAQGRDRYELLGALATLGDPAAVDDITRLLVDRDPATRQLAARALALVGPPDLLARVAPLAKDPEEGVRVELLWILARVDGPLAPLRVLLDDPSPVVRAEAARLIGAIPRGDGAADDGVVPALIAALKDVDPLVRLSAADALVALKAPAGDALRLAARRARSPTERAALEASASQLPGPSRGR